MRIHREMRSSHNMQDSFSCSYIAASSTSKRKRWGFLALRASKIAIFQGGTSFSTAFHSFAGAVRSFGWFHSTWFRELLRQSAGKRPDSWRRICRKAKNGSRAKAAWQSSRKRWKLEVELVENKNLEKRILWLCGACFYCRHSIKRVDFYSIHNAW